MRLSTTRAYPLALQLTEPEGFWASAAHGRHGHDFAKRIPALRADAVCPPAAVSGNPRSVTAPVGPMQQGGTRLSNLDLNGRLVKRGVTVSSHGLRFLVVSVRCGWAHGRYLNAWGQHPDGKATTRLCCESVQVVAPVSRKAAPPVSRVGATGAALPL